MVTDHQVRLLRRKLREGKTQEGAAAAAGMSVRAARQWQKGPLPGQSKAPRHWRTHKDAFAGVWDRELVPLLKSDKDGELQATTLLEFLEDRGHDVGLIIKERGHQMGRLESLMIA